MMHVKMNSNVSHFFSQITFFFGVGLVQLESMELEQSKPGFYEVEAHDVALASDEADISVSPSYPDDPSQAHTQRFGSINLRGRKAWGDVPAANNAAAARRDA